MNAGGSGRAGGRSVRGNMQRAVRAARSSGRCARAWQCGHTPTHPNPDMHSHAGSVRRAGTGRGRRRLAIGYQAPPAYSNQPAPMPFEVEGEVQT